MQTMNDIVFDDVIFPRANFLALLLHQMNGVSLSMPLPHAHLMAFIQVFQNITTFHNHIIRNNQKEITLFTYDDHMQWLADNSYLDEVPQVQKINIFCSSEEQRQYWTTHTRRFRGRIEEPFLYNELNVKLLLFGFDHLRKVYKSQEFDGDNAVQNRLKDDRRKISEALSWYFLEKASSCNNRTVPSQESHS